jgi:phage repressor protein C with HTH and peptisase S24 domain
LRSGLKAVAQKLIADVMAFARYNQPAREESEEEREEVEGEDADVGMEDVCGDGVGGAGIGRDREGREVEMRQQMPLLLELEAWS